MLETSRAVRWPRRANGEGARSNIGRRTTSAVAADERPGWAQLFVVLGAEAPDPGHDWLVERADHPATDALERPDPGYRAGGLDPTVDVDLVAARIMAFVDGAAISRLLDFAPTDLVALDIHFSQGPTTERTSRDRR